MNLFWLGVFQYISPYKLCLPGCKYLLCFGVAQLNQLVVKINVTPLAHGVGAYLALLCQFGFSNSRVFVWHGYLNLITSK